jgi:NADPH-dependent 2,4-dienoyl-CoA reductase/sulfur reductase-like enzyme/rhodanese-related sulfurtransferase
MSTGEGKRMKKTKLVIIGGVAAGASAAAKARRCDEDAQILLFEKGEHISYATCGLPYYLSGIIKKRDRLLVTSPEFFAKRFNVEVRIRHEVVRIDRPAKRVVVKDLRTGETYEEPYDRLVIATGAEAIIPPIPGIDSPFVYTLKTLEDTDRIFAHLDRKKPKQAVIIGGGLIGMEAMENLVVKGMRVSVVEFMPQLLPFMDTEMALFVQEHAKEKGIALFLNEKVTAIETRDGKGWVHTNRERELPADLVILSVGIRPNVSLAKEAGLTIGSTGGIVVDQQMRTAEPDIFAAGDCVEGTNLVTGKPTLIPMGSAANKEGRAAGANAMGRNISVKGFTGTIIVKVIDLAVAKTGLSEKEAIQEGFDPVAMYVLAGDHADYYPGATGVHIKTVSDRSSGRLLGAQVIGKQGVDKRIDVFATAIYNRMDQEELLQLDLAYAPPFSSARDPVIVVGALGQNFFAGDWRPITPVSLHEKIERKDDFLLIDVRTPMEVKKLRVIPGAVHIPIDDLRNRLGELDPEKEIILYCAVGLRSYVGNRLLAMKGFKNVQTLTGGISTWPYPKVTLGGK